MPIHIHRVRRLTSNWAMKQSVALASCRPRSPGRRRYCVTSLARHCMSVRNGRNPKVDWPGEILMELFPQASNEQNTESFM